MLIQPNINEAIRRSEKNGMKPSDTMFMSIQRWLFIDAAPGDWKRKEFKRRYANHQKCLLLPCGVIIKNGSTATDVCPEFDDVFEFANIRFIEGTSIAPNDLESVIYHEIR